MGFFARPNLEDLTFKQLPESQLTLSGQTRIASTSGLTLTDGLGGYVPITLSGASSLTNNYVLTYRDDIKKVVLMSGGTAGGSGIYPYNESATTTVGGLLTGTNLYNVQVVDILQEILVPTLNPTLSPPFGTFTINPPSLIYEIGRSIAITGTSGFNRGSISPAYSTSGFRSGVAKSYGYTIWGSGTTITSSASTNVVVLPAKTIISGNNSLSSCVTYNSGEQPKNSSGGNYGSPLPSGNTTSNSYIICGQQPWFWGSSTSAPAINQTLLNGYTCKCVASSANAITVDNYNVTAKYIWFAIPDASPARIGWQGANNPSNNGTIAGGLFPAATVISVTSPESCWGATSYKFYVSNYATNINYGMTFCK